MRTSVVVNDYLFKNLDTLLKKSKSKNWFFDLRKIPNDLKNKLKENISKIKKEKNAIIFTNNKEDVYDLKPNCFYTRLDLCKEDIWELIKASQEVDSKILIGLNLDSLSLDEIKYYCTKLNYLDNSILYMVRNEEKPWEIVFNYFKDLNFDFNKILFFDLMPCIATKNEIRYYNALILEQTELINNGIFTEKLTSKFIKKYEKFSSKRECIYFNNCFGKLKINPDNPILIDNISGYTSVEELASNNINIAYGVKKVNPRNVYDLNKEPLLLPITNVLQNCRINKNFNGRNFYYIWDWKESVFFNRPLEDVGKVWQEDPRGLMSMNWKFIASDDPNLTWKQKCDCLLPKNGFTTSVKVKFDDNWTEEKMRALNSLTIDSLKKIILRHGGEESKLKQSGNDLFYNNKKFAGKEWIFSINAGYIENMFVTCDSVAESKWFEKIYHHPKEHPITGITNEIPEITKELLLKELNEEVKEFFSYW